MNNLERLNTKSIIYVSLLVAFLLVWSIDQASATGISTISPPVVTYPTAGEYDKSDMAVTWNSVPGAVSYGFGLRDLTTNELLIPEINLTQTNYTIPTGKLTDGHQYRIYLAAQDTNGNKEAGYSYFKIKGTASNNSTTTPATGSGSLVAPTVTTPTNNSTLGKADILVKWNSVSGATGYSIGLRNMTTNVLVIPEAKITQTNYTFSADKFTGGHQYRIYLAAEDANGNKVAGYTYITITGNAIINNGGTAPNTGTNSLVAPTINAPTNNSTVFKANTIVSWNAITGAKGYFIGLRDLTTNVLLIPETKLTQTSYTIPQDSLTPGHQYRIFIAVEDYANNKYSGYSFFKVQSGAPDVPATTTSPNIPMNSGVQQPPKVPVLPGVSGNPTLLQAPLLTSLSNQALIEKQNLALRWNGVANATKYIIAVRDLTTNQLIVPELKSMLTNYTLPATLLAEGHQYKIYLAAESVSGNRAALTTIINIRAKQAVQQGNAGTINLTGLPVADQVTKGSNYSFKGILSTKSKLSKVTLNVRGKNTTLWSSAFQQPVSAFDLKGIAVNTSTGLLSKSGTYTIEVWVKTLDNSKPTKPVALMTLTVKDGQLPIISQAPKLNSFPSGLTRKITLGESYQLEGSLSALEKITKVTMQVSSNNFKGQLTAGSAQPNSKFYNLNSLKLDTKLPAYSKAGLYQVSIWVKTEKLTTPRAPLATMVLEVRPGEAPIAEGIIDFAQVPQGSGYRLGGRITSRTNLTEVTATLSGKTTKGSILIKKHTLNPNTSVYELSNLEFSNQELTKTGTYVVELYAKSVAFPQAVKPLASIQINVAGSPPRIEGLKQYNQVYFGDKFTLQGLVTADSSITKVTAKITNYEKSVISVPPGTSSYSLNKIVFDTRNLPGVGIYAIEIWVKTTNLVQPAKPVGRLILEVKNQNQAILPTQSAYGTKVFGLPIGQSITISKGATYGFDGILFSGDPIEYINLMVKKDGKYIESNAFKRDTYGMRHFSFDKLMFSAIGTFGTPGDYTVELWVKLENKAVYKPSGTFIIKVK